MMGNNKRFFSKHAKSSAIFVSLAIHAVLIVLALSMVAITVITKEDVDFEAKQVNRPKMPLKKLQVPVKVKTPPSQPKLRKQIVATPKINKMPDIKMPEIVGVKGGLGSAGQGGFGGAASLGFAMPEFDMFGIKGKGEKVFIILDASPEMMIDERGGIPAYTLIKDELVGILEELPPMALFNVSVYDYGHTCMLFPSLTTASSANVDKAKQWLAPLNAVRSGMGDRDYGTKTLGPGGNVYTDDFRTGIFESQELWYRPVMLAMEQQADTVFILSAFWGDQRVEKSKRDETWNTSLAGRKWTECFEKAKLLLDEENKERSANGQPPRVMRRDNAWVMNAAYFPDIERPPEPEYYYYKPRDFVEAFLALREKNKPSAAEFGLRKKNSSKTDFSLNVVYFKKLNAKENYYLDGRSEENFNKLAALCNGEYQTLAGLDAIRSSMQD